MPDTRPTSVQMALGQLTKAERRRIPKRPPKVLPPANAERKYARKLAALTKRLETMVQERLIKKLPALVAAAEKKRPGERTDDYVTDFNRIMAELKRDFGRLMTNENLKEIATEFATEVNKQNKSATGRALKASLGVDPIGAEPWLAQEIRAAVTSNVNLIKTLPTTTFARIESTVLEGVRAGRLTKKIAEDISKATGATKSRAQFIARDQAAKISGDLAKLRQEQVGITEYIWSTSRDERVVGNPAGLYPKGNAKHMNHFEREGKTFKWAEPPEDGHPGVPINCIPGDSKIQVFGPTNKLFRRWYDGELTQFVTSIGETIATTPNHPILTVDGWKPAKLINIGEDLIKAVPRSGFAVRSGEAGIDNFVSSSEEIFNLFTFLGLIGGNNSTRFEFHGDGVPEQEVNVIDMDSGLAAEWDSLIAQKLGERLLSNAETMIGDGVLHGSSEVLSTFNALGCPPKGIVRGACKILALLKGHPAHPENIRLTAAANFNTLLEQVSTNDIPRDSIFFREGKFAFPRDIGGRNRGAIEVYSIVRRSMSPFGSVDTPDAEILAQQIRTDRQRLSDGGEGLSFVVKFDRVVKKFRSEFSAHVYNLETGCNWFTSQGFIIHNCRCVAIPKLPKA